MKNAKTNSLLTHSSSSRRLGSMLGNVLGDALGAPFEFLPVRTAQEAKKRAQSHMTMQDGKAGFKLKAGGWTDDASMGLCLAEALMEARQQGQQELTKNRLMDLFYDWWTSGHNNGRGKEHSIGLGGVISSSINNWKKYRQRENSIPEENPFLAPQQAQKAMPLGKPCDGNGSIMRSGAAAAFAQSPEEAMKIAYEQSVVTTPGKQSANCSRLLAYLCYSAISSTEEDPLQRKQQILSDDNLQQFIILTKQQKLFTIDSKYTQQDLVALDDAMMQLCNAQGDDVSPHFNWRTPCQQYQTDPSWTNAGYYGAYVMHGMSLALHIIQNTFSFEEALQMAASMQGDADSVSAIVGQLAGSVYGVETMPLDWVSAVNAHPLNQGSSKTVIDFLADDCLPYCGVTEEDKETLKRTLLRINCEEPADERSKNALPQIKKAFDALANKIDKLPVNDVYGTLKKDFIKVRAAYQKFETEPRAKNLHSLDQRLNTFHSNHEPTMGTHRGFGMLPLPIRKALGVLIALVTLGLGAVFANEYSSAGFKDTFFKNPKTDTANKELNLQKEINSVLLTL